MMIGIPIISSDIPMNLEAVENNKTALVHQLKDASDLTNKMEQMILDYTPMIEMGKRARGIAVQKFDIQKISQKYEGLLVAASKNK